MIFIILYTNWMVNYTSIFLKQMNYEYFKQFKREINRFEYEIKINESTNELIQVIWMYPEQK